jgi:hypothetical protein
MLTSTGAPAAFARALGCIDDTNGHATATIPAPPTTLVAAAKKRRRFRSAPSVGITYLSIVVKKILYIIGVGTSLDGNGLIPLDVAPTQEPHLTPQGGVASPN